jgi:predicted lipoprotein with Yx(FWY)xxD motif
MSVPIFARILTLVLAASLALAACGSSNSDSTSTTAGNATTTTTAGGATVTVAKTGLGQTLVGPNGHTLYLFEKDKGDKSSCTGACTAAWPALASGSPAKAGSGVSESKIAVASTSSGAGQVIYNGHPLYYYAEDGKPGQTNGQGSNEFGGEWYAMSPSGQKIEGKSSSSGDKPSGDSSSGDSSSNYGY